MSAKIFAVRILICLLGIGTAFAELDWGPALTTKPEFERLGHSVIVYKDSLWLIAGIRQQGSGDTTGLNGLNDVWKSGNGQVWLKVNQTKSFPPRSYHSCMVFQGKIWVIGGRKSPGFSGYQDIWSSVDGVHWDSVPGTFPFSPRWGHASAVFKDSLWIIGGDDGITFKNDVWASHNGINWTLKADGQFPARKFHGATVFQNQIWIIGGTLNSGGPARDVWSASTGGNWTIRQAPFNPTIEELHTYNTFVFRNRLWVMPAFTRGPPDSGHTKPWTMSEMGAWRRENTPWLPLNFGFGSFFRALPFSGKIFSVGGQFSGKVLSTIEFFTLNLSHPGGQVIKQANKVRYDSGEVVQLTPIPDAGYRFDGWSGSMTTRDSIISITMDEDKFLEARFVQLIPRILTVKNINGQGEEARYSILDGNSQTISATVPPRKTFMSWQIQSGGQYITIGDPNVGTTSVTLSGGDATIEAVFDAPKVRVWVRDNAAGDRNQVQPIIKIANVSKTYTLTDFDLNFYFNTECISEPILQGAAPGSWSTTLIPENGLYKVRFTFSGTLLPGQEETTPTGVALFYPTFADTCLECPSQWRKHNDWSLINAGRKFAELLPEKGWDPLTVVDHPGPSVSDTLFGRVPGSELIFRPSAPTLGSDPFYQPLDPPSSRFRQIPNLTSSWTFPQGNFVSNGSFENGKTGWHHFGNGSCNTSGFTVDSHGPTTLEGSVDGFHHARIDICSSVGLQGIYFEVTESDPAFNALLNAGTATFSAWVRGDGSPDVAAQLVYYEDSTTLFGSGSVFPNGNWTLVQHTVNTGAPFGPPGERVFRFGIAQANFFTGPIFVDGATLVPGYAYIPPQQTAAWTNTRNAVMQRRTLIPADPSPYGYDPQDVKVVVTNTEYDSLGRLSKTYLPVADPCPGGVCNPFFDSTFFFAKSLDSANRKYVAGNPEGLPDADSFAYSKTTYEQDPLTSVLKTGSPGRNFQVEDSTLTIDGREHSVRVHYAGVGSLSSADLGNDPSKPANTLNPLYAYHHKVDPDKNESMEWKNSFDQVVKSASVLMEGSTRRVIATENVYDERGNLIKVLPPISCQNREGFPTGLPDCVPPSTYAYDSEARLVEEFTPDTDTSRFFYDLLGTKRIVQSAEQRRRHALTVSVYDEKGRVLYTGEYRSASALPKDTLQKRAEDLAWPNEGDPAFSLFAKYFYDEMPPAIPQELADYNAQFGKNVRLYPVEFEGTFQNTKGRLCAVLTYQDPIESFNSLLLSKVEEYASTAFRHDKFGRVIETYKYNGFVLDSLSKLQKITSDFDISGRVVRTDHFFNGEIFGIRRDVHHFAYNALGQLKEIQTNSGKTIAAYTYYPSTGQVKTVELDKFGSQPITVDYTYEPSGAVRSIVAQRQTNTGPVPIYEQALYYDLLPAGSFMQPRFGGSLSHQEYQFGPALPNRSRVGYAYDNLNRLIDAVYYLDSAGQTTRTDRYSESIRYKDDGRIRSLRRGSHVQNSTGGEYHYFPGRNRLAFVDQGMSGSNRNMQGTLADPNFAFDASGRLVADRSRQLHVKYDFRNRPLEFTYTDNLGLRKDVMRYDEAGERISKIQMIEADGQDLDALLVDGDPSRERDFGQLAAALNEIEGRVGMMTQDPGDIAIHVVPDDQDMVDMLGIGEITAFAYAGGEKGFDLVGIFPESNEYAALLSERDSGFALQNATHYTGIGQEIREEPDSVSGQFTSKLLLDMPYGLGRYEENSPVGLYYLKNHLGSTVATALADAPGWSDIYDYFPYGMQEKPVASGGDKVTPTFTGKEIDEGTGLYYFGARYFDPDLGLWTSPDAVRQFHSPYAYSANPITNIDSDGNVSIEAYVEHFLKSLGTSSPEVTQDVETGIAYASESTVRVGVFAEKNASGGRPNIEYKATVGTDNIGVQVKTFETIGPRNGPNVKIGTSERWFWDYDEGFDRRLSAEVDYSVPGPNFVIPIYGAPVPFTSSVSVGGRGNITNESARAAGSFKMKPFGAPFGIVVDFRGPPVRRQSAK